MQCLISTSVWHLKSHNPSNILTFLQHEKALHALANALLEYETLSAEEIKRLLLPHREGRLPEQQEQEEAEGELVLA